MMLANKQIQRWLWVVMMAFFSAALLINPIFGWLALGCMLGPLVVAIWKGRFWCGWMCPRGSFFDNVLGLFPRKRKIPRWLKHPITRWGVFTLIMLGLTYRLIVVWGDLTAMGGVLFQAVLYTTLVGIGLGVVYNKRSWCAVCPMGTLASIIGKGKQSLQISNECVSCNACTSVCPSQIAVADFKQAGQISDGDCLKCQRCVTACRRGAIVNKAA